MQKEKDDTKEEWEKEGEKIIGLGGGEGAEIEGE